MTPITFVEPDDKPLAPNICLYGPAGSGKTVAGLSLPGPVLVLNADRPEALWWSRRHYPEGHILEVRYENAKTLDEVYLFLRGEDCPARAVVVDPVGEIYTKLADEIGGARITQQQWGDVISKLERFLRALRDLPIPAVFICHEQIQEDSEAGRIVRPLTGGTKLPEKFTAMMDLVAYTKALPETEEEPRRYVAQLVEAKGRRAKDSFGVLGAVEDLDLTDWIGRIQASAVIAEQEAQAEDEADGEAQDATEKNPEEAAVDALAEALDAEPEPASAAA